jgi:predicted nucleic acid-binding protein
LPVPDATKRKKKATGATDVRGLPERIMLDSGVVIRALEHDNPSRRDDPRLFDCRELWMRALRESRVLLPPFVVLEVLASGESPPLPLVRAVEHVPFSYQAAEQIAKKAGSDVKRRAAKDAARDGKRGKKPRSVVSHGALIVGTAAFHGADVLVTLDEDVKALAKLARVPVAEPKELLRGTQRSLFG